MTKNKLQIKDELTEFLLYTTPSGKVKVEIFFHNENIWLTQKRMAELFGINVPAISKHLNNIYESGKLDKDATISILETVQKAFAEYEIFNKTQKIESDFDKEIKNIEHGLRG